MRRQVYLDNNATTRLDPRIAEAMQECFLTHFGNAASIHQYGQRARRAVETAREQVAACIGARPKEIIFTSGGTEADNSAILGLARSRQRGGHIITTKIEHPAILRSCETAEAMGFRVSCVGADSTGVVPADEIIAEIADDTFLISMMYANNETGTIQPLQEVAAAAGERNILIHTDAVQAVGKIPVDVSESGVDLLSLSAHKLHGPKGAGALFIREGVEFAPTFLGGGQERGLRGGTQNVPGIVGLGLACELAVDSLEDFASTIGGLRDRLETTLLGQIEGAVRNGSASPRVPHVSNISFVGISGESLLVNLDLRGVAVSTGAACASGSVSPSHVLSSMEIGDARINSAIRFSLGRTISSGDIDYAIDAVLQATRQIREASPSN